MARGVEDVEKKEDEEYVYGVKEGSEIRLGDPNWLEVKLVLNMVLECHLGSSSLGLLEEDWFALVVTSVENDGKDGLYVEGELLGCEDHIQDDIVANKMSSGGIHLCGEEICSEGERREDQYIHVKRIRCWSAANFKASYLSQGGKKILKDVRAGERKKVLNTARPKGKPAPGLEKKAKGKPSASVAGGNRRKKENKKKDEIISLDSGDDDAVGDGEGEVEKPAGMTRAGLKDLFKKAKDRMTHGGATKRAEAESEDSSGGRKPKKSRLALEERRIVSGTNFNPGRMTPLAIEDGRDTSGGGKSRLKKRTLSSRDPGDQLLAQAAQQGDNQMGKKRRKDKKEGRKVVELLKKAVGGKKRKKEKKKRKRKRKMKKEPGDPDGSDGSSSSSETSSSSSQRRGGESDSELSYEPPLRKKALSAPGSVLTDLIKHAQEQLDKGALMDHDGQPASLTSGIKLSTYFALLIRPYFPNNNPLLRELYQLAQSIDLLRMGKLAETGDALASRFVAVHTAMTDGNWQVAAQLELFPLEQVQSTTTSTMLQAQRHRRLLWKAQGFSARPFGRGRGNWQKGGGDEKGYEKGWKTKGKGRGKGKWQNQGGKDGWSNPGKGEGGNPWKDNKEETAKKA